MQRPRNHQGRGRGRGGFRGRPDRNEDTTNVPSINQVVTGAFVSLVLKVDQPTGREVQGVVADVLTRGNHPRGIKVRLTDGRVGRVQRMVSEETARLGSEGLSGLGRNGETGSQPHSQQTVSQPRFTSRYRDVREEEGESEPTAGRSLQDFLPVGHPLREDTPVSKPVSALHTCPVCGEFEGDEEAVSHHVGTHFD